MMKYELMIAVMILLFSFSSACSSDNYDDYYADQCDTSDSSYSGAVLPVLQNRCISCHNGNFSSGNVRLDTYDEVKKHADNGRLLGSVRHEAGYCPMPQGSKLDDCTIVKIEKWIAEGALNN